MINYGLQHSSSRPQEIEITENYVFQATNIEPYEERVDEYTIKGYSYNCVRYTKDEYIKLLAVQNKQLEKELTDTQVALCDLYEALGGDI